MKIQHNLSAINSQRIIQSTNWSMSKNLEKLSSGYQINRAGDDSAGLAISEGMRAQITALNQGKRNTQDGISLVQTVEGALTEVHSMLNRMKGMAVQAANGTYSDVQRAMMNLEMDNLKEEIGRIGTSTNFSGVPLFTNGGTKRDVTISASTFYHCTLDLTNKSVSVNYAESKGRSSGISSGGYDFLAERLVNNYIPLAVDEILKKFTPLQNAMGTDQVAMELRIEYIDGSYGTMAYAKASFQANGKPFNMQIVVDAADFSDDSVKVVGSAEEGMLVSTIAHEMMHSVMQYTLTDGMFGRNGKEKFPEWFIEGTAQLTGGGFTSGWNAKLQQIAGGLTDQNDKSKDTEIENYLKSYNVKDRPYGHGYLATAYIGYLASGSTSPTVDANMIADGMNEIFADLLNGDPLSTVLSRHTGGKITDSASLERLFDQPDSSLTEFVRKLSVASQGGAGSVIGMGGLHTGGSFIDGGNTANRAFYINKWSIGAAGKLTLSVGGHDQLLEVDLFRLDSTGLRLGDTNIETLEDANEAVEQIDAAIEKVSEMRSHYGAIQNRLEHTLANLSNTIENITAAESRIRDTDMAFALTEHVRNQILMQSGQSMLAQANRIPENILSLLSV